METSRKVEVEDLPPGYEVTYHENRGYDSPNKWYEARFQGLKIGKSKTIGYGSADDAAEGAREHHHATSSKGDREYLVMFTKVELEVLADLDGIDGIGSIVRKARTALNKIA